MADKSTRKGLEVIGAGFGRTGTVSLKKALEILGYDPCYHMINIVTSWGHVNFWLRLAKGGKVDFEDIYKKGNYIASCDNPASSFWREQLEQYPEAKVILTVRDPERWFKSFDDSIYRVVADGPHSTFLSNFALRILNIRQFHLSLIKEKAFHGDYSKDNAIKCFNEHNAQVIAECPKDKLLVYEVSQGWEPLCKFLGKPIPEVAFPHLNDTNEVKKAALVLNIIGGVAMMAITLPLVGVICYLSGGFAGCCQSKTKLTFR